MLKRPYFYCYMICMTVLYTVPLISQSVSNNKFQKLKKNWNTINCILMFLCSVEMWQLFKPPNLPQIQLQISVRKWKPQKWFFNMLWEIYSYRFICKPLMWPFYVRKSGLPWKYHKLTLLDGIDQQFLNAELYAVSSLLNYSPESDASKTSSYHM